MLRTLMIALVTSGLGTIMLLAPPVADAQPRGKGGGAGVPPAVRPYANWFNNAVPRGWYDGGWYDGRWYAPGYYYGPPQYSYYFPDDYYYAVDQRVIVPIQVSVPANAELWIFDQPTPLTGPNRRFLTPPLANGQNYWYEFTAAWMENGALKTEKRTARFQAGAQAQVFVDFTRPAPAPTARPPEPAKPPVETAPPAPAETQPSRNTEPLPPAPPQPPRR